MTEKEKQILDIIRNDPMIQQSDIAKMLGISRSTVAVHISSLQKQGYLLGKGYVLSGENYIVGIGACNVDVYGKSRIPIRTHYDHPADIVSSVGGVMHNIICNYTLLSGKARLITAYGDDPYGEQILRDCKTNGIDIRDSLMVKGAGSGIFMQVQDENNDMYLAICDMSILEHVTPEYIREKQNVITNARITVIDPSLPEETIDEIIQVCKNRVPVYTDPISDEYAVKMRKYVPYLTMIKPKLTELENLADMKIRNNDDQKKACRKLLEQGLEKIAVSLGKDGILYMDRDQLIRKKFKEEKIMINASGAGDAMMAALLYGETNGMNINDTLNYGLAAGIAAIRSVTTINKEMSIELLDRIIKENEQ